MAYTNSSPRNNDKIIFKCDQHSAIISEKLQRFYEDSEFFDTNLVAGANHVIIQAHGVVLCSLSEYFLEVFRGNQSNLKMNIVELKEIDASTLKLIVDFMYSGSIVLSLKTVEEILRIASFLKIKTLIDGCCGLIEKNINFTNCLIIFKFASELNIPKLKTKVLEYTYTYFEEISKNKEMLMLSEYELMDLLFNNNPHGDIEEYVFLSIEAWLYYDKPNREHLALKLFSKVRFQFLTPKFIIENRKSICKTIKGYELICRWLQWHLSLETRSSDQKYCDIKPRKMPDRLAVIKVVNDNKINIDTFNPKLNSWSTEIEEVSHSSNRYNCSIIIAEGKYIVVGGYEGSALTRAVEYLDMQTSKWINLSEMASYRSNCQLVYLNGYLCVYGGDFCNWASLEIYNFSTKEWHKKEPLYKPSETSRIAGHNGMLYILDFEKGYLQCYDVLSNKWSSKIVQKDSLKYFGFSAVEGFLFVFGGCCEGQFVKNVKRYDLLNDSWSEMSALPNACSGIKTTVFQNKIITASSGAINEYNFETNIWTSLSDLKENRPCNIVHICTLPDKITDALP